MRISIVEVAGAFAEDKDIAARLRKDTLEPALASKNELVLDFSGVRLTTQSFVHALISDVLRKHHEDVLNRLTFKGCTKVVRGIVEAVVQYSLESVEGEQVEDNGT